MGRCVHNIETLKKRTQALHKKIKRPYLVKVCWEGQLRVQVVDESAVIRTINEDDMIVPDDQSFLFATSLLSPQRHHSLPVKKIVTKCTKLVAKCSFCGIYDISPIL